MSTLTVGGIDPSSKKIAIVESRVGSKRKPFLHVALLKHDKIEANQFEAFDFVTDFCSQVKWREGQAPTLFLEAPVMGKGGPGATIPQAFVSGAIMAAAHHSGAKIKLINNSTWKKRVCGNGNIPKTSIGPWVEENWPELYRKVPIVHTGVAPEFRGKPDQDLLDAGCLNIFGWWWVRLFESLERRRYGN